MTSRVLTGGGLFDAEEEYIYFLAGTMHDTTTSEHPYSLMAVNDLDDMTRLRRFEERLNQGKVMLDSGIFWLTQRHARRHGVHMDDALGLHPSAVDGYDWLYESYLEVVTRYEDRLWGYVELDQGGAVNKRETRAHLEAEGLRPIPVYHPLVDGWEYFDELASTYDRICVGNIVQANPSQRKRLMATVWERRRRHPGLRWVHLLGYTPNQLANAYPPNSADSSTYAKILNWGAPAMSGAGAMGAPYGRFPRGFSYRLGDRVEKTSAPSYARAVDMLQAQAYFSQRSWRGSSADLRDAFCSAFPDPYPGEDLPERLESA
jgi:hypothetical protein